MHERESTARTLAVAGAVALFCSLLVSLAVYWLRPLQLVYRSVEQSKAIVAAAGLASATETLSDREVMSLLWRLDARIVDLDRARYTRDVDAASYDYRAAKDDPLLSSPLDRNDDPAGLGRRPRYMPVYISSGEHGIERLVLPVFGRGMWSTIHGYVTLEADLATVASVVFYEHGETPGIGDRIQNPAWTTQWAGKRLFDSAGRLVLRIGTADGAPVERIDAIAGATITVNAIDRLVRFWFGAHGYGPFLEAARAGTL